uniref:PelB C-terminal domain-containing protein n=1 Tax=uncultured Thiotrichaceae bacterium TaxID=298394 RepID=A0A6S6S5E4_9GAMM|nr:MAG: Unknown protein [uncultured Thiotrichaceae bacterium]
MKEKQTNIRPYILPMAALLLSGSTVAMYFMHQHAKKTLSNGLSAQTLKARLANRFIDSYHQVLENPKPDPVETLQLAESLSKNGYWQETRQLLDKHLSHKIPEALQQQVATLRLKNRLNTYYNAVIAEQDAQTPYLEVRDTLLLAATLENPTLPQLKRLASYSADFQLYPQASELYTQLAKKDQSETAKWWAEAAKWAKQAGFMNQAEIYLQQAYENTDNQKTKKLYKYAWLRQAADNGNRNLLSTFFSGEEIATADPDELQQLAEISQKSGQPELTAQLYADLSKTDMPDQAKWLEKSAHWSAQAGLAKQSAELLQQAFQATDNAADQHALLIKIKQAWLEAEYPEKALEQVQKLLEIEDQSASILNEGVQLALATKQYDLAQQWNSELLATTPNDPELLLRQVDIAVLAEDYQAAEEHLQQALKKTPNDIPLMERLAYLAERNNNASLALSTWGGLYKQYKKEEHLNNLVRVSQDHINGLGLEVLLKIAESKPLHEQAVTDVFLTLNKHSPSKAQAFLSDYLKQHRVKKTRHWNLLTGAQLAQGNLNGAIETWVAYEKIAGANAQSRLSRLQLYWDSKQPDKATLLLPQIDKYLTEASSYQLEILLELSKKNKDHQRTLTYSQQLIQNAGNNKDKKTAYLMAQADAWAALNKKDAARNVLLAGWQQLQSPVLLLKAMQDAVDEKDFHKVGEDLKQAKTREQLFELIPQYWAILAEYTKIQKGYMAPHYYQHLLLLAKEPKLRNKAMVQYLDTLAQSDKYGDFDPVFTELDSANLTKPEREQVYKMALDKALERNDQPEFKKLVQKSHAHKLNAATPLLLAQVQQAFNAGNFTKTSQLANEYETQLTGEPQFWAIRTQVALKKNQKQQAKRYLQKTLALEKNPGSMRKNALITYLELLQEDTKPTVFNQILTQLQATKLTAKEKKHVYEIALSRSLKNKDNKQLASLIKQTDRYKIPVNSWLQFASALQLKDKPKLSVLLAGNIKLSVGDRFTALRVLNRDGEAYQLSQHAMHNAPTQKERQQARTLALSLAENRVSSLRTQMQSRQAANHRMQQQNIRYQQGKGIGNTGYGVEVSHVEMKGSTVPNGHLHEKSARFDMDWQKADHHLNAALTITDKNATVRPGATVRYSREFNEHFNASVALGIQENIPDNTSLRANAYQNRVQVNANANLGNNKHLNVSVWQKEYKDWSTRKKMTDGTGATISLLHRKNLADNSQWYTGIQGNVEKYHHREQVNNATLPSDGHSANLLLGYSRGNPGKGIPPQDDQLNYALNLSVGKQWPTNKTTQHLDAAIGKRLSKDDELSLNVFYDKTEKTDDSDYGFMLQYRKWIDL